VLDLGLQPLANNLVASEPRQGSEPRYPLGIQLCRACQLVQLTWIVEPTLMFSSYRYVPSTSTTWLEHCEELANFVCAEAGLGPGALLVEIGSNDGTLLRAFQRRGLNVLGIDPAANIAARANADGVPTLNHFFAAAVADEVLRTYGPAHAVVSTNVLAHVPNPVDLLQGVRRLLAADGLYVNESPSLRELVLKSEFDTIYHEHVSYLSLHALCRLCAAADLRLVHAVPRPVHGGTLRILAVPGNGSRSCDPSLERLLDDERDAGILDSSGLGQFAARVELTRSALNDLVRGLRRAGRRIAAYGATAKGNTLLAACGLDASDIEYIVDRNPLKQGLLTPGLHIPIVSPAVLTRQPPHVLLVLAWNLADEIRQQLAWFSEAGGQFLIPVPTPRLL
jgi:novobiocin biosynthesis protein NovU/D-mycarose 3-C-methyltransferase